jgi:hypothetical protein
MTILKSVRLNGTVNFPVDYVTPGLRGYYDASNPNSYPGSGTTWFDISGNGRNVSMTSITYSTDAGGALTFASGSFGTSNTFSWSNNSFTISVWIRPTTLGASVRRFVTLQGALEWGVSRLDGVAGSGQYHGYASHSGGTFVQVRSNGQVINNTYQNFTLTYNGTTLTSYKNNNLLTTAAGGTLDYSPTTNSIVMGSAAESFIGNMYAVMIYDRALTAQERTQNHNVFRGRFGV